MGGWKTSNSVLLLAALLAGLIGWLYYRFDPAIYPFPQCPFLLFTGYKCPGCGSQRAVHCLLHGDLGLATQANVLFVLTLPYVLFGMVLEYTPWGRRQLAIRRRWYGYRAALAAFVVICLFWMLRNLWDF